MDIKNITFVITTYKSENTIYNCLNSLPKEVNKIILETASTLITERGATRLDDQTSDAAMEERKKEGYF